MMSIKILRDSEVNDMMELILMMTLSPLFAQTAPLAKGPFQPCVWPNTCAIEQTTTVASDYEICLWPRKCGGKKAPVFVAQFQPCVWPNPCAIKV